MIPTMRICVWVYFILYFFVKQSYIYIYIYIYMRVYVCVYVFMCEYECACVRMKKYEKKRGIQRIFLFVVELFTINKRSGFYLKTSQYLLLYLKWNDKSWERF